MLEEVFEFHDWKVKIKRKLFRRGMTLTIDQNLEIKITTGLSSPSRDIAQFLSAKKNWLLKHYKKLQTAQELNQKKNAELVFKPGGKFPFLGQDLFFHRVPTPLNYSFVSISPPHLLLHLPLGESAHLTVPTRDTLLTQDTLSTQKSTQNTLLTQDALPTQDWIHKEVKKNYYSYAKRYLMQRIHFWSSQTGLTPKAVSFKTQRSRWGSCSSQGRISLNLKLVVFPQEVIDYVIVHELCHLAHLNHSQKFWDLVTQYLPRHKELSKILKEDHWKTTFL